MSINWAYPGYLVMAKTNAEKQREQSKIRRDADPVQKAFHQEKEREQYRKKIEKGMGPREHKHQKLSRKLAQNRCWMN